jgi:hypothetical protein
MEKVEKLHKIPIEGLEKYRITKSGKIWSKKNKKFLSTSILNGYMTVNMKSTTLTLHRLVAKTFINNPDNKPYVNHINSNKLDNNVKNLEWVTQKENTAAHNKPICHPRRVVQLDKDDKIINTYDSLIDASKSINMSPSAISKVVIGQNKTAGGFKWIYEDNANNPIEIDLSEGKIVKDYEKYMVFPNGNVYNNVRKTFVKPIINASGYCYITLCCKGVKKNIYVHRLVAETFIENKDSKTQVNHLNKMRNDNRKENLEWVTPSENMIHANKCLVPS